MTLLNLARVITVHHVYILVPKSNGTYRMCTDYRKVNSVTKTDYFPIPRIDDCWKF